MKYYEAFKDHVFKEYSKIWENVHDIALVLKRKKNYFRIYEGLLSGREN